MSLSRKNTRRDTKLCFHCGKILETQIKQRLRSGSNWFNIDQSKDNLAKCCPSCFSKGKTHLSYSLIKFAMPPKSKIKPTDSKASPKVSKSRRTDLFKKYKNLEETSSKGSTNQCKLCKKTFKFKYSLSDHFLHEHSTDKGKLICPICSMKYDTHMQLSTHIEWSHNSNPSQKLKDPNILPQVRITRLTETEIQSFTKKETEKPVKLKPEPNSKPKMQLPRLTQEDIKNLPKPVIKLTKIIPKEITSKLNGAKDCKVVVKRLSQDVLKDLLPKSQNVHKNLNKLPGKRTNCAKPKPKVKPKPPQKSESWTSDTDLHKELRGFDELGIEHDDLTLVTVEKLCPPEDLNLESASIKMKWMDGLLSNIARPRSDFKKTMTDILDKICPEVNPRNILYE